MQQPSISKSQEQEILRTLSPSKIILPIAIGLLVIAYLIFRDFNWEDFAALNWGINTVFWLFIALLFVGGRHFAYMYRVRHLTEKKLSWRQAFEVIILWEFGSAATPSSVGGTALALFLLTKEKIKAGESTSVVLATIFLDSIFFLMIVPVLWLALGNTIFSPDFALGKIQYLSEASTWVYFALLGYGLTIVYTLLVIYGLFISPRAVKSALVGLTSLPLLKRWRNNAVQTGDDMIVAAKNFRQKSFTFWFKGFMATLISWVTRFGIVNCIILAAVGMTGNQIVLFSRQVIMHIIMLMAPTPGGSGVAEFAFKEFLVDFVPIGLAVVLAGIWRLLTYYLYLILGVITIPPWIRRTFSSGK